MTSPKPHRAPITPASVRLGSYLRNARGDRSQSDVARRLGVSASWLTHVEQGKLRISRDDVARLMEIYGRSFDDRPNLTRLLSQSGALDQDYWEAVGAVLDPRDLTFMAHETEATSVRTYELALIPGLLQTEGYARAILATRHPRMSDDAIKVRLEARIRRQQILSRLDDPAHLHAVISEAALRFQVGGFSIWLEQMRRLAQMCERPNVMIQILPFSAGAMPAAQDSFTLLSFGPDEPTIAAVEQQQSAMWLTQDPDQVAGLAAVHDTLCRHAMTREKSSQWIWEESWATSS